MESDDAELTMADEVMELQAALDTALAEVTRMKEVASIEARVLKEVALGIGDVFPETRRIIEISVAQLAALAA